MCSRRDNALSCHVFSPEYRGVATHTTSRLVLMTHILYPYSNYGYIPFDPTQKSIDTFYRSFDAYTSRYFV